LGLTSKHQPIANPRCGSGWKNKSQLLYLNSSKYFQSAAVPGRRNAISQPAQSPVRCLPLNGRPQRNLIVEKRRKFLLFIM
jgi:hypothetical protein